MTKKRKEFLLLNAISCKIGSPINVKQYAGKKVGTNIQFERKMNEG